MRLVFQQVREYTLCTVRTLHYTTSGQRKNPTHPPHGAELLEATSRQRGGRSPTVVFTPSFPSFAPYAPQWLTAIGICPFSLIPDYSLYAMSVLILYP
jgi:hypothetical protein